MSDKEIDIRAIELQGAKKYLVEVIEQMDEVSADSRKGFGWLFNSKTIQGASIVKSIARAMLDDINKKIARHIPS